MKRPLRLAVVISYYNPFPAVPCKKSHMPPRIPKACRKRGCGKSTTDRSGYCEVHKGAGWERHNKGRSATRRGYGAEWRKVRNLVIKRDKGLCQTCKREGVIRPGFGSFREVIKPGAFDDVLGDDVRALFNHDPNFILGRSSAGTLSLSVDDRGLRYENRPGLMVRIAPNQKRGEGNRRIEGDF